MEVYSLELKVLSLLNILKCSLLKGFSQENIFHTSSFENERKLNIFFSNWFIRKRIKISNEVFLIAWKQWNLNIPIFLIPLLCIILNKMLPMKPSEWWLK